MWHAFYIHGSLHPHIMFEKFIHIAHSCSYCSVSWLYHISFLEDTTFIHVIVDGVCWLPFGLLYIEHPCKEFC
jgi:hypothetical protein